MDYGGAKSMVAGAATNNVDINADMDEVLKRIQVSWLSQAILTA